MIARERRRLSLYRWLSAACVCLAAAGTAQSACGAAATPGVVRQCGPNGCRQAPNPATCRIRNQLDREAFLGSGTLVDKDDRYGLVVTAQHTFRGGAGTVTCTFPDGQSYKAKLVGSDGPWDLAALLIVRPEAEPVSVAARAPGAGETVWSCGYGPDGQYRCNQGRVTGYVRSEKTATSETLELTGSARQGDSGGPVLNAGGELVAVLWGTDGRTVGGTYCGRVDKFLQETTRYLLPWNAKNDPIRWQGQQPPAQPGPGSCPSVDLSGVNQKLDRIADLLTELRKAPPPEAVPPSAGLAPIPGPEADRALQTAEAAKQEAAGLKGEISELKSSVGQLTSEEGGLFARLKARIDEAKASGAEGAAAVAKSVVWGIVQSYGFPLGAVGAVLLFLVYRDIRAKITTGDPLLVEKVAARVHERLGPVRERIIERVGEVRQQAKGMMNEE